MNSTVVLYYYYYYYCGSGTTVPFVRSFDPKRPSRRSQQDQPAAAPQRMSECIASSTVLYNCAVVVVKSPLRVEPLVGKLLF